MATVQKLPPPPVRDDTAVRVWRFVREPFRADTWRRVGYALLAFPVGMMCVPLALVDAPTGRWQRTLVRRFLGAEPSGSCRGPEHAGYLRSLAHALLATPLNLLVLASSPRSSRSSSARAAAPAPSTRSRPASARCSR
ncbi:hypothetical protein AB0D27_27910 [Streptomyces sp. NPDC048415]|uniref:hypothetical protein n=1 Tax=Streptomyces sp. NPDC048415 TaxID=3154822 RepID=UPI0034281B6C